MIQPFRHLAILSLLWALFAPVAVAQTASPKLIPFQGRLTKQDGGSYANNQYTLTFNLYDQAIGGNTVWTERHEKVSVINGMVNVFLGSVAGIGNVNFATTKYLGITVDADDNPATPDPEMVPRTMIIPAFHAKNSDTLAGFDWSAILEGGSNNPQNAFIRGDRISLGSITSDRIVDGTITFADLQPGIVDSLSGSLVQSAPVPSFTALEDIAALDAVAVQTDNLGISKIVKASTADGSRSAFYGFAKAAASAGDPVTVQQYGPLSGFSNLVTGMSHYLGSVNGQITATGGSVPVYVGHAMSSSVLFVDSFGATRSWGGSNYWGNGSDGELDTAIAGSQNFGNTLDGPVVVKQFSSLRIRAGHTVTTQSRCKGLVVYVNGDCTIDGTLSMTARGASVNPVAIPDTGIRLVRIKSDGPGQSLAASDLGSTGVGEVGDAWKSIELYQRGAVGNGKIYTIAKTGGAGGAAISFYSQNYNGTLGNNGLSKQDGSGGGGSGTATGGTSGRGGAGTCYSGGAGGGGFSAGTDNGGVAGSGSDTGGAGGNGVQTPYNGIQWASAGGGAGNLGGAGANGNGVGYKGADGTGGLLILLVKGNLTIGASGMIESRGSPGGDGGRAGGSSGGGRILVLHGGTYSAANQPTAVGGSRTGNGGAGGDGSVTVEKINP
ncbi:MAG: hypothetical protein J0M04_22905 [Verrucomicrobia bacterium]|nr:hypothetical protein [Verrucomicrobiota bacterium]